MWKRLLAHFANGIIARQIVELAALVSLRTVPRLRASELYDLQWSQIELATGRLHVRRAKNGSPSVHPMQGDEIRALQRLHREQGLSSHVFMTERRPRHSMRYSAGSESGRKCRSQSTLTC
jgi:integrase